VQAGDSLGKIAARFNVTTDSILWANDMVGDSSVIKPGMKLRIPPVSGVIHTIKKGDTISAIAARYEVDETTILEYNDLSKRSKLSIGKDLMIPGGAVKVAKVDEKKDEKKIASATIASKETKKPVVAKAETKKTSTETKKTSTTAKKSAKESYAIKYTGNGR
jgi:LysM repeat protein